LEQGLRKRNLLENHFFYIRSFDLFSLATLFIGLTIALLLGLAKSPSRRANLCLSLTLIVVVLKAGGLSPLFLPALGPLLYFYVQALTCPDQPFHRNDLFHLCPLLAAWWLPVWLSLILVIIYLYLSHRLIQRFYDRLQPVLMDRPRYAFRRLERLLLLLGTLCFLSLFNNYFSFGLALVLMGMAAEAVLYPERKMQLNAPVTDRSDAREQARKLKEAIAVGRLYADAELTLASLALKLGIHPQDLSSILNNGLQKNFNDFINEFRVREVARKLREPQFDRFTLLGIAYESGFNSQRTFNRAFKEVTGKTPVEYKNGLKKELPKNNLAGLRTVPGVILRSNHTIRNIMLKNYLKIVYRQLLRQKMYAAIKIGGFALGIDCDRF